MEPYFPVNAELSKADGLLIRNLLADSAKARVHKPVKNEVFEVGPVLLGTNGGVVNSKFESERQSVGKPALDVHRQSDFGPHSADLSKESTKNESECDAEEVEEEDQNLIDHLVALSNPKSDEFEPTVFVSWDVWGSSTPAWVHHYILKPYVQWAGKIVRNKNDVVMITHLLLYFTTSLPSALFLYYRFTWLHGILHWLMQAWHVGTYTSLIHQHIHMGGILSPEYSWLDTIFPYITDPLSGHTWNTYYYHHVKHHHVEGNGPNDLSSTLRYQRDDVWDFLHYVGRFFFFIWFDLPLYYIRKNQMSLALKTGFWELADYTTLFFLTTYVNPRATLCVFLLPLLLLRLGLMIGNWAQHAFIDEVDPDSDFRSSITLIDVASNRYCFSEGYHTSHHLNPRRHWREHPISFLKQKKRYATEQALVFHNIDFIMFTVKLLQKDYAHLARCLVPMGSQIGMSHDEIAAMLRPKTHRFSEEEIRTKFSKAA